MMPLWELLGILALSIPASAVLGALVYRRMAKPVAPRVIYLKAEETLEVSSPPTMTTDLLSLGPPYIYEYLREVNGEFVPIGTWIPTGLDPHLACINRSNREGVSYAARRVQAH